jgi:hypothetical protein
VYPLFSAETGRHVPASAFSSFVIPSPGAAPEALDEPWPVNSKKPIKRVGKFLTMTSHSAIGKGNWFDKASAV